MNRINESPAGAISKPSIYIIDGSICSRERMT